MATFFATLMGNLYLVAGSVFFGLLASVLGWIPPRGNWMYWCARLWAHGLLWASGVRVMVSRQPLDPRGRYVFMANHQSLFDIPVLLATLPGQVRFMAKESLFRIPVFGWALHAGGFIPVDRRDRTQARQAFSTAGQRLAGGSSILVFPESTRTDGTRLLPFQRGGFLIALKSGLGIVPVGIRGSVSIQVRGSARIRPGSVEVHYGAAIDVAAFGVRRKEELMEVVRRAVAGLAAIELGAQGVARATREPESPGVT
jgi:1-acyl-sn-glycerol-3-phosphate acyltransferase